MTKKEKGWIRFGNKEIPINDISIRINKYHTEYDKERKEEIKVVDNVDIELPIKHQSCEKCKNLVVILQDVNGEIMHCGYNCKKSSMREDDIKKTRRCELYTYK